MSPRGRSCASWTVPAAASRDDAFEQAEAEAAEARAEQAERERDAAARIAVAEERARIEVGAGSAHTAFLPDGRTAFVGCSIDDHLAVIDLEDGARVGTITLN